MEERKEHGKENKPERGESSCQQNSFLYANGWKWNPTSMASDGNVIYVQPISQVIVYPCLSLTEWETVAVSIIYVFLLAKQWMVWCHSNVSLRTSEMLTVTSDFHVRLKWWQILDKLDMLTDSVHMYTLELLTDNDTRTKCMHWKCWHILEQMCTLNCWQILHGTSCADPENFDLGGSEGYWSFQGDPRQIFGSFTV